METFSKILTSFNAINPKLALPILYIAFLFWASKSEKLLNKFTRKDFTRFFYSGAFLIAVCALLPEILAFVTQITSSVSGVFGLALIVASLVGCFVYYTRHNSNQQSNNNSIDQDFLQSFVQEQMSINNQALQQSAQAMIDAASIQASTSVDIQEALYFKDDNMNDFVSNESNQVADVSEVEEPQPEESPQPFQLDEALALIVTQWPDDACRLLADVDPHLVIKTLEDHLHSNARPNNTQLLPVIKILASYYQGTGHLNKATDLLMIWLQDQISKQQGTYQAKPGQALTDL
ncbi:MAG: hypothetical protein CMD81_05930 [Gammaproteobacteria bacterium]|nr:hypothetical protein [Gammaproteobacteria bacterium]HBF09886.1 hypothetical protein [Gammaproteobacteria bacterium]|tara:strand:- start:458 stop:1330 length:873 start_codon:yes stop_codon:yes gene_type:complete